jgi:nucleoside-diphosphate-sugar epimerase
MSTCVVTGAAGFVGSHLSEALIARGHRVIGVDAFVPYYPRPYKDRNLAALLDNPAFSFHELDLREAPLTDVLQGADVVFHLAAMAGLMKSWSDFHAYASCNAEATQRLLDAARDTACPHFIYVSTSSVYGKEATGPEDTVPAPFSPYGITKLAGEHLCRAYEANFDLPITILRYFSVYGPRQRPDMAYHILIRSLLRGEPFTMFGDGEQTRSNTFCLDGVEATLLAFEQRDKALGQTFNVGGGEIVSLNTVRAMLEELLGKKIEVDRKPARPGDQKHTAANIEKLQRVLGYQPRTGVYDGLKAQIEWQRELPF